ncbi:MAG: glycosyltransferase family 2 protein [Haloferacaceae archaeon]
MYRGSTVGVVVPAYNEAGHVGEVIDTMPPFVDRIYAVDDASTDDTWNEIRRHAERANQAVEDPPTTKNGRELSPRVVTIRHERNRGVGAAIKAGYRRALRDGIDATAVMAGDGQMNPNHLGRLVDPVVEGTVDYAKGNRLHSPENRRDMSRWRLFGNGVLTLLTRISSGYWSMTDPQNGFTVISHDALDRIRLDRLYDRYGFANELLVELNGSEFPIADVSHPAVYGDERSHIRYASFVPTLSWILLWRFLWRLKTRYLVREFHPIVACYPAGFLGIVAGVAGGVYALVAYAGSSFLGGMMSLVLLLLGVVTAALAVWFDFERNEELAVSIVPEAPRSRTAEATGWQPGTDPGLVGNGGEVVTYDRDRLPGSEVE